MVSRQRDASIDLLSSHKCAYMHGLLYCTVLVFAKEQTKCVAQMG